MEWAEPHFLLNGPSDGRRRNYALQFQIPYRSGAAIRSVGWRIDGPGD
jgi:hypothetical protein